MRFPLTPPAKRRSSFSMYATKRPKGVTPRYADEGELAKIIPKYSKLTKKQVHFIELMASGVEQAKAGEQSGLSSSGSRYRTLTNPLAVQYLSSIRAESRAIAAYDLATAMQEALDVLNFAKEKGNAMAYCKAVELRAKLSGLLIDRVEIATVDLRGALSKAEQRVLNITPVCTQSLEAPAQAQPDKHAERHASAII